MSGGPSRSGGGEEAGAAAGAVWRLDLAYEGTAFSGWAKQPGRRTVEAALEEALFTVLREPVRLSVAGRTDGALCSRGSASSGAGSCSPVSA